MLLNIELQSKLVERFQLCHDLCLDKVSHLTVNNQGLLPFADLSVDVPDLLLMFRAEVPNRALAEPCQRDYF